MPFNFNLLNPDTQMNLPSKNKKKQEKDKSAVKKTKIINPPVDNQKIKKKKADNDLKAMAFGLKTKSKSAGSGKKKNINNKENVEKVIDKVVPKDNDGTDDDWQKRDDEFVRDENEKSLHAAILQSKLDLEKNKSVTRDTPSPKKEEDPGEQQEQQKPTKSGKNKKKKEKTTITLSLDQFNTLKPGEIKKIRQGKPLKAPTPPSPPKAPKPPQMNGLTNLDEEKFFNDVEEVTRQTLLKERRQEAYKSNANNVKIQSPDKGINTKLVQEIEKRDFENQALRLEVDALKDELKTVKTRNKRLCELMSSSEMRSKGELVVELEKTTRSRDEIAEEVARLNGDLEQERTKVSNLTIELKRLKAGGRKRAADSK